MKRVGLLLSIGVLFIAGCSGNLPPKPPEKPPEPQCIEGQAHSCWHHPPDSRTWLYACPVYDAAGGIVGVVNVVGGPAQCPAKPEPPPTCAEGEVLVDGVCKPKPGPEPPPDIGPTPPKDEYVFGDLLLRQPNPPALTHAGVPFNPFGCIQCCAEDIDYKTFWPQAGPLWMDYVGPFGCNYFHFRGGPFKATGPDGEPEWEGIGGPYNDDGSDNAVYWQAVRDHAFYAGKKWGANVQYVFIDTWGCKVDQQQGKHYTGWPSEDVNACGRKPSAGQKHHIEKAVDELSCLGNISWITGNESSLIGGATLDWQEWVIATARSREQTVLCKGAGPNGTPGPVVHIIGVDDPQWQNAQGADYVSTHERGPLRRIGGGHTENNEHNPEFSPEEEHALACDAEAKGLHWWFWNAGMKKDAREKTLSLRKQGCGTSTGCFTPPSEPAEDWEYHDRTYRTADPAITQAVEKGESLVGSRCGQTGPSDSWNDPDAAFGKQFETIAAVAAEVRKQGFCASGPWGDALAVTRPDGLIEERHIIAFGTGCYTSDPNVNPKSYWRWLKGTPPQPPQQSACANPAAHAIDHFNVKEHTKGDSKTVIDSTPIVHDAAYCASIGFTDGRIDCSVRMEGDQARTACEAEVVGTPLWTGLACAGCKVAPDNPYMYWVPRGVEGKLTVCASANPGACGSVQVTK